MGWRTRSVGLVGHVGMVTGWARWHSWKGLKVAGWTDACRSGQTKSCYTARQAMESLWEHVCFRMGLLADVQRRLTQAELVIGNWEAPLRSDFAKLGVCGEYGTQACWLTAHHGRRGLAHCDQQIRLWLEI